MPSTGLFSLRFPVEPQKGAPKENTPPSAATIQYPEPSGATVELTTGASSYERDMSEHLSRQYLVCPCTQRYKVRDNRHNSASLHLDLIYHHTPLPLTSFPKNN